MKELSAPFCSEGVLFNVGCQKGKDCLLTWASVVKSPWSPGIEPATSCSKSAEVAVYCRLYFVSHHPSLDSLHFLQRQSLPISTCTLSFSLQFSSRVFQIRPAVQYFSAGVPQAYPLISPFAVEQDGGSCPGAVRVLGISFPDLSTHQQ